VKLAATVIASVAACVSACGFGHTFRLADTDGGGPGDAGDAALVSDAGIPVADANPASLCDALSPQPKFCDDFERSDLSGGIWITHTPLGGTLSLDTADWRSPTHSLLATTPGGSAAGAPQDSFMYRNIFFSPLPSSLAVLMDVKIASPLPSSLMDVGGFQFQGADAGVGKTGGFLSIELKVYPGYAALAEVDLRPGGTVHPHAFTRMPALDQWQRWSVLLTLGTNQAVSVQIDNVVVVDDPLESPNLPLPPELLLHAGIGYAVLPDHAETVHYDNVMADWH